MSNGNVKGQGNAENVREMPQQNPQMRPPATFVEAVQALKETKFKHIMEFAKEEIEAGNKISRYNMSGLDRELDFVIDMFKNTVRPFVKGDSWNGPEAKRPDPPKAPEKPKKAEEKKPDPEKKEEQKPPQEDKK